MQGVVKPGRSPAEADEKVADESSSMKHERPLSPNLSDFVVVPENFSFDSSGFGLLFIPYFLSFLDEM